MTTYGASSDVLFGGEWVQRGLGRVWVEHQPEPDPSPAYDPNDLIVCPCGARLSEPCRTAGGNWTSHADRVTPRRCPCGNLPRAGSLFCTTECREEAPAATYAEREKRTPTRLRRRTAA